jgi:UMP-CMP kinase
MLLFFRGAAGSGRDDDNPETLHKRFETYNKDTMPMVEHLEKEGLLRRIDAKRSIDEVYVVSQISVFSACFN